MTGSNLLLTTSCTHATEMAALLSDIQPGDEVIMPSYTFVSTADVFVLRGAKAVFVDIRPDTMNIDENLIEAAIFPFIRHRPEGSSEDLTEMMYIQQGKARDCFDFRCIMD